MMSHASRLPREFTYTVKNYVSAAGVGSEISNSPGSITKIKHDYYVVNIIAVGLTVQCKV